MTIEVVGLGLGCLMGVVFMVGARARPSAEMLARIEGELGRLRTDVVGYRVAHEHLMGVLDRRLDAMEQTTATAMNELRMASGQLTAPPVGTEAPRNGARA